LRCPRSPFFEVFKRTFELKGEGTAFDAVATLLQGRVVDLSAGLALEAARISIDKELSLADSIILATARSQDAVLWTQDAHFSGLEGVEYRAPHP
jgi:predicted nucleic acid-binding protein